MGLRDWIVKAIDVIVKARDFDPPFPPFVLCPICGTRTFWLEVRKVWRCQNNHSFMIGDPMAAHFPPPPDYTTGDHSHDGEI